MLKLTLWLFFVTRTKAATFEQLRQVMATALQSIRHDERTNYFVGYGYGS